MNTLTILDDDDDDDDERLLISCVLPAVAKMGFS